MQTTVTLFSTSFTIDWIALLVHAVHLFAVYGLLKMLFFRTLLNHVEARRAQVIASVAHAERVDNAYRELGAKKVAILAEARLEAERIVSHARARADTVRSIDTAPSESL